MNNADSSYVAETYDPQGNVVQPVALYPIGGSGVANSPVRVTASTAYDAFGISYGHTADGAGHDGAGHSAAVYEPAGFGGQFGYYHEYTGHYLLGHRFYDADMGRFVTHDPIGYKGGINLYGFTGNNPVNESDPSGFEPRIKGDPDDPTGLPRDDEGHWHGSTMNPSVHDGTHEARRANAMRRSAVSVFFGALLAVISPEGKIMDEGLEALQVARAARMAKMARSAKPWTLAEHAESTMMHPRFGRFYKAKGRNEWWSVDTAGHGGSAFKVFRQEGREMKWIEDADKNGNFLRGKHKGPTGLTIPLEPVMDFEVNFWHERNLLPKRLSQRRF